MLRLFVLLFLGTVTLANECQMGEWGDWSECRASRSCEAAYPELHTTPMEAAEWDEGRLVMAASIKYKTELYAERQRCVAAGECPELMAKPRAGYEPCVGGSAGDNPCFNTDQMSFIPHADLGPANSNRQGNDVWGWYDTVDGNEYALMGLTDGTSMVRITDASNPEVLFFLPTVTASSTWRDIKVIGDYAFIGSEAAGHGMQVFDLTRLRGASGPVQSVQHDALYPGSNSHNIVANEATGYVYVVGATRTGTWPTCSAGLHAVDVRDPLNPVFAGCFSTDGYTHDAECVVYHGPDSRYTGREVCFAYNENSLTLVDVTDKANMVMISKMAYTGVRYSHQGWVTEDHSVLLLDDELDEANTQQKNTKTYLWDISDMQNPELKNVYTSSATSIDHNQYTLGDYTYQSNYEAGLRVLRIDQAAYDLTEVAYFDVFPSRTTAEFSGTWSNYPYLPSSNIPVSSIEYGLYILRVNMAAAEEEVRNKSRPGERQRFRALLGRPTEPTDCPALQDTQVCQPVC